MFKTTFSKYLTAFVLIIFISFLMLSSIITSMVRSYVTEDKEKKLQTACTVLSNHFADKNFDDIESHLNDESTMAIISERSAAIGERASCFGCSLRSMHYIREA